MRERKNALRLLFLFLDPRERGNTPIAFTLERKVDHLLSFDTGRSLIRRLLLRFYQTAMKSRSFLLFQALNRTTIDH
jgi:hypothetical protein